MPISDDTSGAYSLTVYHGEDLDLEGSRQLQTIRRTLLGLQSHGTIREVNTYSDHEMTVFSYRAGDEDPSGIMDGLVDLVEAVTDWSFDRNDLVCLNCQQRVTSEAAHVSWPDGNDKPGRYFCKRAE